MCPLNSTCILHSYLNIFFSMELLKANSKLICPDISACWEIDPCLHSWAGFFLVLKYLIHRCSQQSPRPFFKRKLWSVKRLCRRLPRNPLLARQTPSLLPFSPQLPAKAQVMAMFSGVFADNSLLDGNAFTCLGLVYLSRVGLSGG